MADTCDKCGRSTHGSSKICSTCRRGEDYHKHGQSLQRREFFAVYAAAQSERVQSHAARVEATEQSMRDQGLDPNKHNPAIGD